MQAPLNSRKAKSSFEINWNIREIFSETVLASIFNDIDSKNIETEKAKKAN